MQHFSRQLPTGVSGCTGLRLHVLVPSGASGPADRRPLDHGSGSRSGQGLSGPTNFNPSGKSRGDLATTSKRPSMRFRAFVVRFSNMMVEELQRRKGPEAFLLGRMVHLDTCAPRGTPVDNAPVMHLDLAINAYFGDAAPERERQSLSDGRVCDASVRTHILRIEDIPFSAALDFARRFFLSSKLFGEWCEALTGSSPWPQPGESPVPP